MPYNIIATLALSLLIALALFLVYHHRDGGSQIRLICGPQRGSLLWGVDLALLHNYIADIDLFADWSDFWGNVYRIPTVLGGQRLVLLDPTAVSHIVHTHDRYQRPAGIRDMLHRLVTIYLIAKNINSCAYAQHRQDLDSCGPRVMCIVGE